MYIPTIKSGHTRINKLLTTAILPEK
jgi:hypothetical protein